MKQNLQPPATPLEMLSLFFPCLSAINAENQQIAKQTPAQFENLGELVKNTIFVA